MAVLARISPCSFYKSHNIPKGYNIFLFFKIFSLSYLVALFYSLAQSSLSFTSPTVKHMYSRLIKSRKKSIAVFGQSLSRKPQWKNKLQSYC